LTSQDFSRWLTNRIEVSHFCSGLSLPAACRAVFGSRDAGRSVDDFNWMTRVVLSDPRNSAALGMELAGLFALKKFEDQIAVLLEGTKAALKGAKHRLGNLPVIGFPPPISL
jgi:hypothetical protein